IFTQEYKSVKDSSDKLFSNFDVFSNEIKNGLQFVKFYFPYYPLPKKIITYLGRVDGFGDAITNDGLIVGLQHHLGSNFPLYQTEVVRDKYPDYISRNFTPDYIAVNCMKNVMSDLFPEKEDD